MSVVGLVRWFAVALMLVGAANPCSTAEAGRRVALVVGNSAYRHTPPLANPTNDAEDVAKALSSLGFEVTTRLNLTKADMDRALTDFTVPLRGAEIGLFFYAGHGLQVSGQNHLVPVDAKLDAASRLGLETVRLDMVQHLMEQEASTNVLFLDACRDNPLARNLARAMGTRSSAIGRGLSAQEAGAGTIISYSTQPGNVALDSTGGRNSPFAAALVKHLPVEGRDLPSILVSVRKDVVAATARRQVPWDHSALMNELILAPRKGTRPMPAAHGTEGVSQGKPLVSSPAARTETEAPKSSEVVKKSQSAPMSDVIFLDSFDGNALRQDWTVKDQDPDALLVEGGTLLFLGNKPGGIASVRNVLQLSGVEVEGDWDMSVHFRRLFLHGNDRVQVGLVDDSDAIVYATLELERSPGIPDWCFRLNLLLTAGGTQKAEIVAPVRLGGSCQHLHAVSKREFDGIISGLAKDGATLSFSKRGRNYHATVAAPALGKPVATRSLMVLRTGGRAALAVGRLKDEQPAGQTSAMVDEFRIMRGQ